MMSMKYYLISPQHAFNILLTLYCLNCSTFIIHQVPMCAKKTKFKIQNLKFIMCIAFNKVSPVHTTNQGTLKSRQLTSPILLT